MLNPSCRTMARTLMRGVFGPGICCGLLAMVGFGAGCWRHPCTRDPCSDGSYCNGVEICFIVDGQTDRCEPGIPLECDPGTECDEETLSALIEEWRAAGGGNWNIQDFKDACLPVADAGKQP